MQSKRFLYRHGIDFCGSFIGKKKLNYKLTQKILQKFNFFFRKKIMKTLKKMKVLIYPLKKTGRNKKLQYFTPLRNKKLKNNFFLNIFSHYHYFSQISENKNRLLQF
jgi:hypothetical protein